VATVKTKARARAKKVIRKKRKTDTNITLFDRYTKGLDVALAYGFRAIPTPRITDGDCKNIRGLRESYGTDENRLMPHPGEKMALLRTYMETMLSEPQPVMLYYEGKIEKDKPHRNPLERRYNLEIIGTPKSIAEAIIIHAAISILKEAGFENLNVELNSLGDKESVARYMRELTNYYRGHLEELPPACRQTFKKNVFDLLSCTHEKCVELKAAAPHAINFLSEAGRTHFKELLEYLECSGTSYSINDSLMSDKEYCSHTVYEITGNEKGGEAKPLALGIRYNALTKRAGLRKEVGATGMTICFRKKDPEKAVAKKIKPPQFYYIQMGDEAKHKSLELIEMLRLNGIRVCHNITRDKLGAQLGVAEQLSISHLIIMGQKEFYENVVLVRRVSDRCQETVKISDLPIHLKKL
jgi:histidyl-tRNA synthetase